MKIRMARLLTAGVLVAGVALTAVGATAVPASAYGNNGSLDVWQIGLSANCDNPSTCGPDPGGFWGWVVFTRDPATGATDADADLAGCGHMVRAGGPGLAGADHFSLEAGWTIAPGTAGPQTFFLTGGTMTFTIPGGPVTVPLTNMDGSLTTPKNPFDTMIPAPPGHYSTSELLGFTAPGVAYQIQVAYKPAQ